MPATVATVIVLVVHECYSSKFALNNIRIKHWECKKYGAFYLKENKKKIHY